MTIEYRQAALEDAEALVNIYNASFYEDYLRYGSCPGYGNTKEMMEESIIRYHKRDDGRVHYTVPETYHPL